MRGVAWWRPLFAGVVLLLVAFWRLEWSGAWSEADKKLPLASGCELLDLLAVVALGLARATICVGAAIVVTVIGAVATALLAVVLATLVFGASALLRGTTARLHGREPAASARRARPKPRPARSKVSRWGGAWRWFSRRRCAVAAALFAWIWIDVASGKRVWDAASRNLVVVGVTVLACATSMEESSSDDDSSDDDDDAQMAPAPAPAPPRAPKKPARKRSRAGSPPARGCAQAVAGQGSVQEEAC